MEKKKEKERQARNVSDSSKDVIFQKKKSHSFYWHDIVLSLSYYSMDILYLSEPHTILIYDELISILYQILLLAPHPTNRNQIFFDKMKK